MSSEFIAESAVAYNSDHRNARWYIWSHVRRHWWILVLLVIGAFSNAALASAVPVFIGQAFDEIQRFVKGEIAQQDALNFALLMVLAIIGSQSLRAILQLMRNFSSETFAQRIERDVRDELYGSLLGKSMTFHDMQPVGDIMARVT
ncbi:MAG: ABC transporter ATP-binding protein, partial [Anaerolineae bacterium]|nr:ABC transporter ATP-binding protein [Anaerolineae bacterium]